MQYRCWSSLALATLPPPAGLAHNAWLYFAVFAGVIAALVTEPLPNPAIGMVGLSLMAVLSRYTLFAPAKAVTAERSGASRPAGAVWKDRWPRWVTLNQVPSIATC